jgi:hypothetical protein
LLVQSEGEEGRGRAPAAGDDWVEPAAEGAAGAVAAIIGALLPSDAAPAAQAMAQPLLHRAFSSLGTGYLRLSRRNSERVLEHAVEAGSDALDELVDRVLDDPQQIQLVGQALAAGAATAYEDKLRALGIALAAGLEPGVLIHPHVLVVAAIADLEPPHVQVLQLLAGDLAQADLPLSRRGSWTISTLARRHPELRQVLGPVIATLLRHGLVEETDAKLADALEKRDRRVQEGRGVFGWRPPVPTYAVTEFGLHLLRLFSSDQG